MKLTEQKLREIIRKELNSLNEGILFADLISLSVIGSDNWINWFVSVMIPTIFASSIKYDI